MSSRRNTRNTRKTKCVNTLRLIFYHTDVTHCTFKGEKNVYKVCSVKQLKDYLKSFQSFDKTRDSAILFLDKKDSGKFSKGLPEFVEIRYV